MNKKLTSEFQDVIYTNRPNSVQESRISLVQIETLNIEAVIKWYRSESVHVEAALPPGGLGACRARRFNANLQQRRSNAPACKGPE